MSRYLKTADILGGEGPQPRGGKVDDLFQEIPALSEGGAAGPVSSRDRDRAGPVADNFRAGGQRRCSAAVCLLGGAQVFAVASQCGLDNLLITAVTCGSDVVVVHALTLSLGGFPLDWCELASLWFCRMLVGLGGSTKIRRKPLTLLLGHVVDSSLYRFSCPTEQLPQPLRQSPGVVHDGAPPIVGVGDAFSDPGFDESVDHASGRAGGETQHAPQVPGAERAFGVEQAGCLVVGRP